MSPVWVFARPARSRHGMAPLQAILLLGAAFFVVMAIKAFVRAEVTPRAGKGSDEALSPTVAGGGGGGGSGGGGSSRPIGGGGPAALPPVAAGGADRARERLAQLGNGDTEQRFADLAYRPPTDKDSDAYKKYMAQLAEVEKDYVVTRFRDPETGLDGAYFTPKDATNKNVVMGIAGTEELKDWVVDGAQVTPGDYAKRIARGQYETALNLARRLVAEHGKGNVTVIGHSLGGGIASYIAGMTGVRGFGFNSAGLGQANLANIRENGVPNSELKMTSINAEDDVVSAQAPGRQIGEVITVKGKDDGWLAPLWNHSTENIDRSKPIRYEPRAK